MIVALAKLFFRQDVEDMRGSTKKNAEPRDCRQGERTFLQSFCYSRVFCDSEVVDCAVRREMSLKTRQVLNRRDLNRKQDELGKQERRNREILASKNEEREKELETAKKIIARLTDVVRGSRTSPGKKRRATERGSVRGSGRSPKSIGSLDVRSPAHNKGK